MNPPPSPTWARTPFTAVVAPNSLESPHWHAVPGQPEASEEPARNGLARLATDRIYSVSIEPDGTSSLRPFEATSSLPEFLGELSFSGYREMGYSKLLLVEVSTDVTTVQQFLRWWKKDRDVVVFPLGGSGLIKRHSERELAELQRVCGNVSALIDSKRTYAGEALDDDRRGFLESCQSAGIRCHVLEKRAIENYLSQNAVQKVKSDKYRALEPFEKLADADPTWGKAENWRIARAMSPDDLSGTDLGDFLERL